MAPEVEAHVDALLESMDVNRLQAIMLQRARQKTHANLKAQQPRITATITEEDWDSLVKHICRPVSVGEFGALGIDQLCLIVQDCINQHDLPDTLFAMAEVLRWLLAQQPHLAQRG